MNNRWAVLAAQYASKKQILEAGGRIKKEELKNSHIIFALVNLTLNPYLTNN
ncbi:hypothetical protein HFZ78_23510 [Priestia megaterium]|uniref:Uncharacterized protein n=1 Tax=Priestia megaterium TaxID=1404 RepID=A0A6H1P7Q4_PRIMG|nr:hypothetical protein [Priestia megaterium]QIZ09301.1 hypothetical protein HFZ78_23510 [Priestia megaterium]